MMFNIILEIEITKTNLKKDISPRRGAKLTERRVKRSNCFQLRMYTRIFFLFYDKHTLNAIRILFYKIHMGSQFPYFFSGEVRVSRYKSNAIPDGINCVLHTER